MLPKEIHVGLSSEDGAEDVFRELLIDSVYIEGYVMKERSRNGKMYTFLTLVFLSEEVDSTLGPYKIAMYTRKVDDDASSLIDNYTFKLVDEIIFDGNPLQDQYLTIEEARSQFDRILNRKMVNPVEIDTNGIRGGSPGYDMDSP